ncbi:matrixin family metalloprotease [Aporhodopirellula aestuarii]|uniref:M57 family metalloprotease n=1 Tax=Aporhodopirellula aestuarii TaxID=2950107 RepID=A0ABT0TWI1_9BACT|nr:M57 family metalloprotease [Aporhodopirellula aestuarii]MCM2368999.1 M57 family metalloprotease [Aporhodopirellula aestuarii]
MKRHQPAKRRLMVQPLEERRVLAASLGWDGPGLGSAELTYYIANSPDSLTQEETNAAIETALAAWSDAADITFTPTTQSGLRDSIDISFTTIDGIGGTLAQAYFPDDVNPARIAGDIEFDISDAWEVGNSLGNSAFDLIYVAVHEIGHSLGLDHSDSLSSVLAPFVSPSQFFTSLSAVDVAAAQEVYAAADIGTVDDNTSVPETPVDETPVDDTPTEETPTDETPTSETPSDETPSDDGDDNSVPDDEDDPFPRWRWRRGGNWNRWGGRLDAATPEYNYINPTDVNGDNATTAVDALMIINQLNLGVSTTDGEDIAGLCDTNGDGSITALDALTVINALNSGTESVGAVSASVEVPDVFDDTLDIDDETLEDSIDNGLETPADETLADETSDQETPVNESDDSSETVDDPIDDVVDPVDEVDDLDETDSTDESADDSLDEMIDDGGMIDDSEDTEDETDESDEEVTDEDVSDDEHCNEGHQSRFGVFNVGVFRGDAESLVTRFDADGDASLSEDEVSSRLWEKLSELGGDADSDGLITLAELETAIETARQAAFDERDTNDDGVWSEDEVSERFWSKIAEADIDSVAGVSLDELDTFFAEQAAEREGSQGGLRHRHHHASDEIFAAIGRAPSVGQLTANRQSRSSRLGRGR